MGTHQSTLQPQCLVALHRGQRGQVLPLALAGVVLGFALLVILINSGNRLTEKSKAANIADATALSGATVVAQHLNSMAYLNRAATANHVGAGHMVAYVSWMRYVQEATERFDDIGQFIPYLGTATKGVEKMAEVSELLAEYSASLYVPAVDLTNRIYRLALDEQRVMLTINAHSAMQKVAKASHDKVKINEEALSDFLPTEAGMLSAALVQQVARIGMFASVYAMSENKQEGVRFSKNTWGDTSEKYKGRMSIPWMTNRDWNIRPILKKRGGISHQEGTNCFNWKATDKLKLKLMSWLSWSPWITIASGKANSREFHSGYCGMHGVAALTSNNIAHNVLPITALASISQTDIYARQAFELERSAGDGGVTGMAIAQVEFVRPKTNFNQIGDDEFASLYNPFWTARLVGSSMMDYPRAFETTSSWRDE